MKVWLIYNISTTFPFNALADSIKVFDSYEKMYQYISNYYDRLVPEEEERANYAYECSNANWEECKKDWIENNEDDTIRWAETKLR